MIKAGIIGIGHLGSIHLKLLKESDFFKLIGYYDINKKPKNHDKLLFFDNIDELINSVEAVFICTNTPNHYKISKKCIENLYAVTDSMGATGLQDGIYSFFGVDIEKKNKIAVVKKTNALAGSIINMHDTFSNLIELKFSLNEAVKMTSYNAAQYLKKNDLGYIGENKISNILILDKTLKIKEIYLNGIKFDG